MMNISFIDNKADKWDEKISAVPSCLSLRISQYLQRATFLLHQYASLA
jgi:hypothetical protein